MFYYVVGEGVLAKLQRRVPMRGHHSGQCTTRACMGPSARKVWPRARAKGNWHVLGSPTCLQVVGDEALAKLKERVTACGFYSGPARGESMYGRLGLDNAAACAWDEMVQENAPVRLSFAPIRLDLRDVDATLMRTRRARASRSARLRTLLCWFECSRCAREMRQGSPDCSGSAA